MGHSQTAQQIIQDYNNLYQLWHESDEQINPMMSYELFWYLSPAWLEGENMSLHLI